MDGVFQALQAIDALPRAARRLVCVCGPPGAGKSTFAARLVDGLRQDGEIAALVAMDGFHLDNAVLSRRGLLSRKGAPETFDAQGFLVAVSRLSAGGEVVLPTFDREADRSVAGSVIVGPEHNVVVCEGNYLCFDEVPWRDLMAFWDLSIRVDAPEEVLRERLIRRWRDHGLSERDATARAERNDLINMRRILRRSVPVDLVI